MEQKTRLNVKTRLFDAIKNPENSIEVKSSRVSISRYADADELRKEKKALFRNQPVIVAHVSEIANPRDFKTETIADVPLIILRDEDGQVRTFLNACPHRGARLLDEEAGTCKRLMTCKYHAWSFALDGSLKAAPGKEAFADFNPDELGLRQIACEERHGFVWVQIDAPADQPLNLADKLGPVLDDDFAAFEMADQKLYDTVDPVIKANWKLVMDAFAEGYHLRSLHKDSLSHFFLETTVIDSCKPHVRQVGARKTMLAMQDGNDENWDLREDTTVFYNVFPNSVFVFHPLWISQMSLFPVDADHVRVVHRMLAPKTDDEVMLGRLKKSFHHIHGTVFAKEDLYIAQSIQSTVHSGLNETMILGGMEEGMRLFHEARDEAIAKLN